ncbi:MAG: 16S rRNA (guanine(966)-N(2))-methyltransferase RsmD [Nocardioides sp.]|nr:16S rRNA (guanine(966)-N(2))-methyltransferase RsmD [Nocardioides sp.]
MTRIIGGTAGGRRLRTPPGSTTRPTSDRVREALFSALEASLGGWEGLRVLDLYAGTGAVGLEALSRGAAVATFVEHDRRAAQVLRQNVASLALPGGEVVVGSVSRVVGVPAREPYDLVFADPPYPLAEDDLAGVLAALVTGAWLAPDAVVVVERSGRSPAPRLPEGIAPDRRKDYGETSLWYGRADS